MAVTFVKTFGSHPKEPGKHASWCAYANNKSAWWIWSAARGARLGARGWGRAAESVWLEAMVGGLGEWRHSAMAA